MFIGLIKSKLIRSHKLFCRYEGESIQKKLKKDLYKVLMTYFLETNTLKEEKCL